MLFIIIQLIYKFLGSYLRSTSDGHSEFGDFTNASRVDEDVGRGQVSVDIASGGQILHAGSDLLDEFLQIEDGTLALVAPEIDIERTIFGALDDHHDWLANGDDPHQRDDILVMKGTHQQSFFEEVQPGAVFPVTVGGQGLDHHLLDGTRFGEIG